MEKLTYCLAVAILFSSRQTVVSGCQNPAGHVARVERDVTREEPPGESPGCPCPAAAGRYVNRTDVIKEEILRKLRMLNPPNATSQLRRLPDIPLLHSLIEQANDENDNRERNRQSAVDDDDYHVMAMTILAMSQPVSPADRRDLSDVIQFKLNTSVVTGDDVISARLGVYIRARGDSSSRDVWAPSRRVQVHVKYVTTSRQVHPFRRRAVYRVTPSGHWVMFEVKPLVRRWLQSAAITGQRSAPRDTVSAILQLQTTPTTELVLDPSVSADQQLRPYIEIQIRRQPRSGRSRRAAPTVNLDCDETTGEDRCCRYPLTVDFRKFGWDWILAPSRFEAYYCSGLCSFVYYQVHPVSHLRQQMSQARNAGNAALPPTGTPCCAPTKMAPLPLVYMDSSGGIVLGELPDMVTERCGCA